MKLFAFIAAVSSLAVFAGAAPLPQGEAPIRTFPSAPSGTPLTGISSRIPPTGTFPPGGFPDPTGGFPSGTIPSGGPAPTGGFPGRPSESFPAPSGPIVTRVFPSGTGFAAEAFGTGSGLPKPTGASVHTGGIPTGAIPTGSDGPVPTGSHGGHHGGHKVSTSAI